MKSYFTRLYSYNAWANEQIISKVESKDLRDIHILKVLSHLLSAENLWMTRIEGKDTSHIKVWPELSANECRVLFLENRQRLNGRLEDLSESVLATPITYTNTAGIEYHTPVSDILTHLAMHGTYHRGQIARLMRQSGMDPVNTDFITFVRSGG